MLLLLARTQEPLSSCTMSAGGAGRAWPIVHGRSQVQHPSRSRRPGREIAVGTSFRRVAALVVDLRPFPLVSVQIDMFVGCYSPCDRFFRIRRPVLARERLPDCLMLRGGVAVAWPIVHGPSQVRRSGCSGPPGANWRPIARVDTHVPQIDS